MNLVKVCEVIIKGIWYFAAKFGNKLGEFQVRHIVQLENTKSMIKQVNGKTPLKKDMLKNVRFAIFSAFVSEFWKM